MAQPAFDRSPATTTGKEEAWSYWLIDCWKCTSGGIQDVNIRAWMGSITLDLTERDHSSLWCMRWQLVENLDVRDGDKWGEEGFTWLSEGVGMKKRDGIDKGDQAVAI